VLHISLNLVVSKTPSNETLGIEDSVGGVHGRLVLGGISNQTLVAVEGDVGGGGAVSLIVGDDLNAVGLPDSNAGVGGSGGLKRRGGRVRRVWVD
jgi:hypothetical protein